MTEAFEALRDDHSELLESLLAHQEALVRGDLATARDLAGELHESLEAHARHEEERLLPVLEKGGGWSRIGEPRFYREEHEKLRAMAAEIVEATAALDREDPALHREIVLLIGREHAFRTLMAHHHDREERALFPDIERLTTPEERARLLEPPD